MAKSQPLAAKLGEVKFRQKLVKQQLGENGLVPQEPNQEKILEILQQRIDSTRKIFKDLDEKGLQLSPFLEIGAEKGQRSMVLVNELDAQGFALDLSYESLASASRFAPLLGFKKLPQLVCGDAYSLPFANESLPFVFCFETLHHFPDPTPIIKEIYRVLALGGVFYFGEEPVRQTFNLRLWRRGYYLNSLEKFLKATGILPFVSSIGKAEVEHGVLEEEFSLKTWERALSIFKQVKAAVRPVFFGPGSTLVKDRRGWKRSKLTTSILIAIQGGGIEALCQKGGKNTSEVARRDSSEVKRKNTTIWPLLTCPDCQGKIQKLKKSLRCLSCQQKYPIKNEVLHLLPENLRKKLYP